MNPQIILDHVVEQYVEILKDNLVGIYLHGSLAMGCFTKKSDIDLLVLVNNPLELRIKRLLIEKLLMLPGRSIAGSV